MSIAVMEDAPAPATAPVHDAPSADTSLANWIPGLALLGAVAAAIVVYVNFWQHSLDLWWWMGHDRHTHYMLGLNLAFDIRTFDLVRLFHDFDRMRVWGPLHPMLVGLVELVAGPDHRLAVLPSLCGFIMTVWFAFLIPRRLLETGGTAAGFLAACCVAASPAHRAFATDVMLESLGAGLSLAAIYLYLVVVQEKSKRSAILLGLTLTALFLHKYNYWLLVIFGLTLGEFARQPRAWWDYALSLCRRDRLPTWLVGELKQPLNYLCLAFAAAAIAVVVTGGWTLSLGRFTMSAQEPHNFVTFAYLAFFARLAWWWYRTGRAWSLDAMPTALRTVLMWHLIPVAFWFLLPKRLGYFIWFLSPNNSDQQRESLGFMHGLPTYLTGLQTDYLTMTYGVYIFAALLALGFVSWRWLKPGASALMFFFLIATYLTCQHPMLKYRFMHSWIAAFWIIGSVGLVFSVQQVVNLASRSWAPWVAGATCTVLIGFLVPAFLEPAHAQEGGLKPELPSPLRITETYLPALSEAHNPTILSNVSTRFLWTWTFIEQHRHQNMAAELKNFRSYENNPDQIKHWLATTRSDVLVLIDVAPNTTYDWKTVEYVDLSAFKQVLAEQSIWVQQQRWQMPEGVTITMWKKS
jgi:hypothetical protein